MSWCFAIVNNKLAEIYFKDGQKGSQIYAHCYVRKEGYKTKAEQKWIQIDTKQFRFSYGKRGYKTLRRVASSPGLVGLGPKWPSAIMYYVYIIHSEKNEKLYKGSTEDLRERLKTHNRGDVQSTKAGIPWKLIYYEAFANKSDARREELFLKSGKGRERIKHLLKGILKK